MKKFFVFVFVISFGIMAHAQTKNADKYRFDVKSGSGNLTYIDSDMIGMRVISGKVTLRKFKGIKKDLDIRKGCEGILNLKTGEIQTVCDLVTVQ